MKNKRILIIAIVFIIIAIVCLSIYYFLTREDRETTLTLIERQWIENNQHNVINLSIIDGIPILSFNGEGLIIEFVAALEEATNLSFNKIAYRLGDEVTSDYAFKLVEEKSENDILIYSDNYAIITKNNVKFNSLEELNGLTIGVLGTNYEKVRQYLYDVNVTYEVFENLNNMLNEDNELDGVVLLKTVNLEMILENNYYIAYNIDEYQKHFVLSLGDQDRLNNILTKYFNRWSELNFDISYNRYLVNNFFNIKRINDLEQVRFRSKRYVYGFVDNPPFDALFENRLVGINNSLISAFTAFSGSEVSYKRYNSIEDMLEGFNSNEIDFFFSRNADRNYTGNVHNTKVAYDTSYVILMHLSNDRVINSIRSLHDEEAYVLAGSNLQNYLTDSGLTVRAYQNRRQLLNNINRNSIIIMKLQEYLYYASGDLREYTIVSEFNLTNNGFVIRDISENKIFIDLFDFFLSFNNTNQYINSGLGELLLVNMLPILLRRVAIILGIVVGMLLVALVILKIRPKKFKKVNLKKEDKLRYIDSLTSLKNRIYLNENIPKWDENKTYPQTIIIIDLNNVAYINDNYGHPEGDAVIEQAASILIQNQLENSEVIRTDGNEFLIYLVEYDEKQVITYMRKLSKELKELKYNFGGAIGYSIINDAIKTIDDAINEATLDMRHNKEEAKNI